MPMRLRLRLSDQPGLCCGDGPWLALNTRDAALLAWLALEGPTPRSRLAALVWPDSAHDSARNALRQRLFQLRRMAGSGLVTGTATLALAEGVSHDLGDADTVLGNASDEIGGEFSPWLAQQRERRRARIRDGLIELCAMAEGAKDHADALTHAQELLALEPLSEEAHRRVIRLHYLAGDRAAALLAFDRCEQVLKDEVGTRPSAQTLALLATVQAVGDTALSVVDGPVPASVLRPPRLIGRDAELAALDAAWRAGQVIALIGEAGLGKTRLLQAFAESHAGVVRVAGRPGDAGVPFATLARLLRAVMARAGAAPTAALPALARREIARVLPEVDAGAAPAAGEGQRLVMQRALRALLGTQGQLHGLIVDDLHFADEASLEMLRALIDHGDEDDGGDVAADGAPHAAPPLRWVLAYRPAEAASPVQALHDGLLEQARVLALPLRPLDEAALAALVDSLALPGVQGRVLAPGLLRRTGGNPLFVLETLKQAWVERTLAQLADAAHLPKPQSVSRLIERRIAQLTPGALALARVASIAGVDFGMALAESVLGASAMQFADTLNELEAAQVLRGTQFAHDLVFDAVRHSVPGAIALYTHARVAAWLESNGGEPARVAQHWVDADRATQALPWLQQAADAARRALRSKEYIAFMEHKSRIEEAADDRAAAFDSLLAAAVESVNVDRGRAVTTAHCDGLQRLASTPAQRVEALSQRAHAENLHGQIEQAIVLGQAALRLCLPLGDAALSARVRRQLGGAYALADRGAEALEQLQASIAWADAHADATTRGEAHGELAVLYDNLGRLDDALPHHQLCMELLRGGGELSNWSVACGNLACNRIDAGDLRAADRSVQQGQQVMLAFDDMGGHIGGLQVLRALTLCHLGRYREALAHAEQSIESMQRSQPGFVPRAALRLAHCWWHLGQWARVAGILAAQVPDASASLSERVGHGRLAWACARESGVGREAAAAARERLQAALSELRALPGGTRADLALPLRIELADALDPEAALHDLEAIRREAERIGHGGTVLAARIRAASVAADHEPARARREALAALDLAARGLHNTVLLPGELWLHCSHALAAAGDRDQARRVLQQGVVWLEQTASEHVPELFREGFLHRNPVNRELLALAARTAR